MLSPQVARLCATYTFHRDLEGGEGGGAGTSPGEDGEAGEPSVSGRTSTAILENKKVLCRKIGECKVV